MAFQWNGTQGSDTLSQDHSIPSPRRLRRVCPPALDLLVPGGDQDAVAGLGDDRGLGFEPLHHLQVALRRLPWINRRLLDWRLGAFSEPEDRPSVAGRLGLSIDQVERLEIDSLLALRNQLAQEAA
jgi:hypothetical protein